MTLLRRAVSMAAKRSASDPRIQGRARQPAEGEPASRQHHAAERARPAIEEARLRTGRTAEALRGTATATDTVAGDDRQAPVGADEALVK